MAQQFCVLREEHHGNGFYYSHVGCQRSTMAVSRVPVGAILSTDATCVACGKPLVEIPMQDCSLHTAEHPFCSDATCPCHHDPAYKWEYVGTSLADGLITEDEAARIFAGKQL